MKRMIKSASSSVTIPYPFSNYYRIIDDRRELNELFEGESTDSVAEQLPGYDVTHLAWCVAQDWCFDELSNDGMSVVELVSEGDGKPFCAFVVGDRLIPVDINYMPEDIE